MKTMLKSSCVLAAIAMLAWAIPSLAGDEPKKDAHAKDAPAKETKKTDAKDNHKEMASALKVGAKAPEFTLKDVDGKPYTLSELTKQGKIVVLEWFNHECPVCKGCAEKGTMEKIAQDYKSKNVVFVGIDSTAAHKGKEADVKKAAADWKVGYPILMDPDGKTGKAYGAKTTPHMFVIDKTGTLAYMGAIDNKDKPEMNYVRMALDSVIKGETVATSTTEPYGCSVKY